MNYNEDNNKVVNKNFQTYFNIIKKYCIGIIKKYIENYYVKEKQ